MVPAGSSTRSAAPFRTGGLNHIARATLPIPTHTPSDEHGLGDLVLFDLIVFNEPWGRWGLGPVMLFPTASDDALGSDKWAMGPAIGFAARRPGLLWGAVNQNLFSFAGNDHREDVDVSILQPIVSYFAITVASHSDIGNTHSTSSPRSRLSAGGSFVQ